MAVKIQLRRGTEAEFDSANTSSTITPADGEVLVVQESGTTGGYLLIGDGSTDYLTLKGDEDGRVYFKPGYSKTVMGGEHLASETPLTVRGATSQSVPIFVVEDKLGNDIFKVSDDESSGSAALVAVESHGQTADVVMSVMGQENQDDDNFGGDLLRVQPDVDNTGKGLVVDHSGNVTIVPLDDFGVSNTALKVVAASDNDNPIFRVQDKDGVDLFKVAVTATQHIKPFNLGNTPPADAPADPANFGVLRTGTTPNNTDSGADSVHINQPHFQMFAHGSGANMRGTLILCANSAVDGSGVAFGVRRSGNTGNLATIFYNGKGEFSDGTIYTTGRTVAADSILRADEIYNKLAFFNCIGPLIEDTNYNSTSEKLIPIALDSGSGVAFETNVTTEMFDPPTLQLVDGTNSNPETGEPGIANDDTNAFLIKVPANSGSIKIEFKTSTDVSGFGGFVAPRVKGRKRILRYTSRDATTGKTEIATDLFDPTTSAFSTLTADITNQTFDAFYGFSFDGNHDPGDSSDNDPFRYRISVSRARA